MDAEITIGRGQWFSDVIPVFNPNTIYNKWITGIGGTTTAINDGYKKADEVYKEKMGPFGGGLGGMGF